VETMFIYFKLPETRKALTEEEKRTEKKVDSSGLGLLKFTHLFFLLIFSGMEFSLPFMTYDLFNYSSAQNGRVLGYIGLLASLLQGGFSRRAKAGLVAKVGLVSCATSFFLLAKTNTQGQLYLAATFLAVTSACVVTALNTLASLRAGEGNRGRVLGEFRSAGQIGRAIGPVLFCTLYWWAGRDLAYIIGGTGMVAVTAVAWGGLVEPKEQFTAAEDKKGI